MLVPRWEQAPGEWGQGPGDSGAGACSLCVELGPGVCGCKALGAPRPGSWVLVCAARSWNLWWTGHVQGQPWAWGGLKAAFWWVGLCPHLVSCMAWVPGSFRLVGGDVAGSRGSSVKGRTHRVLASPCPEVEWASAMAGSFVSQGGLQLPQPLWEALWHQQVDLTLDSFKWLLQSLSYLLWELLVG